MEPYLKFSTCKKDKDQTCNQIFSTLIKINTNKYLSNNRFYMYDLIENRQIRVFISSTFDDLQDERDHLIKHVFPELKKIAYKKGITITELDLRWGITEEEAKQGKVIEICLKEIEKSIPFFIGIIGKRYGWCPKSEEISDTVIEQFSMVKNYLEQSLSATEMEMQYGVLERPEKLHAYFFIKDINEDEMEIDDPSKLKELKDKINCKEYPTLTFHSSTELGEQVRDSIFRLMDNLYPEEYKSHIDQEISNQNSIIKQLTETFVPLDENEAILNEWLADWTKQNMIVSGESGVGKSAFLANWIKNHEIDKENSLRIVYRFVDHMENNVEFTDLEKSLCNEICKKCKIQNDNTVNLEHILYSVNEENGPLLLIIDGIDQITTEDRNKLFSWIPLQSQGLKIIISLTNAPDICNWITKHLNCTFMSISPFSRDIREKMIESYLGNYAKKLTDEQKQRIIDNALCKNTFILKTLLEEIKKFGIYKELDKKIDQYLQTTNAEEFFEVVLNCLEKEYGTKYVKQILTCIWVSKYGLKENDIYTLINLKGLSPSRVKLSQFLCEFGNHLLQVNGHFVFRHNYVSNSVFKKYMKSDISQETLSRNAVVDVVLNGDGNKQELCFQYYKLGKHVELYSTLMQRTTFDLFYEKELDNDFFKYWNFLLTNNSNDYSLLDYLKVFSDINNKETLIEYYGKIAYLARNTFCDLEVEYKIRAKQYEVIEDVVDTDSQNLTREFKLRLPSYYMDLSLSCKDFDCAIDFYNIGMGQADLNINEICTDKEKCVQFYYMTQLCHNMAVRFFSKVEEGEAKYLDIANTMEEEAFKYLDKVNGIPEIEILETLQTVMNTRANILVRMKRYQEAQLILNKIIETYDQILIPYNLNNTIQKAHTLHNRFLLYKALGKDYTQEAMTDCQCMLNIYKQASLINPNIYKEHVAETHLDLAKILAEVDISESLVEAETALRLYQECTSFSSVFHKDVARTHYNIAYMLFTKHSEDYNKILYHLKECMTIRQHLVNEGLLGENSLEKPEKLYWGVRYEMIAKSR